jgi:hypothetical protein
VHGPDQTSVCCSRWYDNMTYGRRGKPGNMRGIILVKTPTKSKKEVYSVATFGGSSTSARIVPDLLKFCEDNVKTMD